MKREPQDPNTRVPEIIWRKESGIRFEHDIARLFAGRRVPGSGAFSFKGDVIADPFLISCKERHTTANLLCLTELATAVEDARVIGRTPAMALRLNKSPNRDWILVPAEFLAALLGTRGR